MWKPLKLTTQDQAIPCLLAKYDFGPTTYTVSLTDLTYLWTESLDRKQIIRRALELNTSIDPSEDSSQMQLLLSHVREALEGISGTSVTLTRIDALNKLPLNLSVMLPSPLPPLEWPIILSQASQELFTTHFVLPFLSQNLSLRGQIVSLLENLREKDNVIRKLTDRMHSDGTDIRSLFPGAGSVRSGLRVSGKEAAARSVRGMAAFDESDWREQFSANRNSPNSMHGLVEAVFSSDNGDMKDFTQPLEVQPQWWEHLQLDAPQNADSHSLPLHRPKPTRVTSKQHFDSSFGDAFQRQVTPPRDNPDTNNRISGKHESRQRRSEQKDLDGGDTTTDDSEQEDVIQPKLQIQKEERSSSSDTCDDETVNNRVDSSESQQKNQDDPPASGSTSRKPRSPARSAKDARTEDDQSSDSETTDHATNSKRSNPNTIKKHKHKLGKIGVRNKKPVTSSDEENPPAKESIHADMPSNSTTPTKKSKHKLGKIGGRTKSATSSDKPSVDRVHAPPGLQAGSGGTPKGEGGNLQREILILQPQGPTGRPQIQADQSPPGRITEIRANENRERLKRELELKSSTANKKKRKF